MESVKVKANQPFQGFLVARDGFPLQQLAKVETFLHAQKLENKLNRSIEEVGEGERVVNRADDDGLL